MKQAMSLMVGLVFALGTVGYAIAQTPAAPPAATEKKADEKKPDAKKADAKKAEAKADPKAEKKDATAEKK